MTFPAKLAWILCLPLAAQAAGPVRFTSGPAKVLLVELYTSEGCSSCPPAERWMGDLIGDRGLWKAYVPVSFHVNYWDKLGWKDRFASRAFTQREYDLAAAWGSQTVYTPCFALDGAEWRPTGARIPEGRSPAGVLTATLDADGSWLVTFAPAEAPARRLTAHVALLGGGFSSKVTAGENRGSTLKHEFAALALADRDLAGGPDPKTLSARVGPTRPDTAGSSNLAVAVWITPKGGTAPLQATGGWLKPPS